MAAISFVIGVSGDWVHTLYIMINNYSPKWRCINYRGGYLPKRGGKYGHHSPTLRWIIVFCFVFFCCFFFFQSLKASYGTTACLPIVIYKKRPILNTSWLYLSLKSKVTHIPDHFNDNFRCFFLINFRRVFKKIFFLRSCNKTKNYLVLPQVELCRIFRIQKPIRLQNKHYSPTRYMLTKFKWAWNIWYSTLSLKVINHVNHVKLRPSHPIPWQSNFNLQENVMRLFYAMQ